MGLLHKVKNTITSLTGYWIWKRNQLPRGIELYTDLKHKFNKEKLGIVFDVGANVGQSIVWYKKYFPQANIYSFEPVKSTFAALEEVAKNYQGVFCENIALGNENGEQPIYIQEQSTWNSLVINESIVREVSELVSVKTLDRYMESNGIKTIDFLKIDTEGFELEVLKGAHQALSEQCIDFIYCEVGLNEENSRMSSFFTLTEHLSKYPYSFYSYYDIQGEGEKWCHGNALFVSNRQSFQTMR